MGVRWEFDGVLVLALLGLCLCAAPVCEGGITSSYVRNKDLVHDMPLDSDVFRVPPGYNAPQQVKSCSMTIPFFLFIIVHDLFLLNFHIWFLCVILDTVILHLDYGLWVLIIVY